MKKRACVAAVFLAACAARFPVRDLPRLPEQEALWLQVEQLDGSGNIRQTTILSIQGYGGQVSRWLLADAFGVPQARMLLSERGWQRDGFVRPNREAQDLFTALMPYVRQGFRQPESLENGGKHWRITPIEP